VVDATRSVSKTHLEFGQEAGAFWLRDRFSGNGSVLRAPESPPFRCEAGKRYRVSRGSRIDIGEQFFVVS
jgi:predicted component of type VI protein secretion system